MKLAMFCGGLNENGHSKNDLCLKKWLCLKVWYPVNETVWRELEVLAGRGSYWDWTLRFQSLHQGPVSLLLPMDQDVKLSATAPAPHVSAAYTTIMDYI